MSGSKITKLKNKNIKIYGNTNISSASNGASLSGFSSEDYEFANIEEIGIGDVVRSWNENTNTFENKRVTQVFVHEVPQLFFLELDEKKKSIQLGTTRLDVRPRIHKKFNRLI
ncbi:hypothetical protein LEP1GSC110_0307 [Leptospira interrogans serovar Medanensis str. UT053]|nr:hypothetical protein LEP1GSC110_0307 [Leptospira interrogans serovar Medanensis str. UT053]